MDGDGNLVDAGSGRIVQNGSQRASVSSLMVNSNAQKQKEFKVEKAYIEKDRVSTARLP
jgi:hypothetical protein